MESTILNRAAAPANRRTPDQPCADCLDHSAGRRRPAAHILKEVKRRLPRPEDQGLHAAILMNRSWQWSGGGGATNGIGGFNGDLDTIDAIRQN